jgi:hypothetical protein
MGTEGWVKQPSRKPCQNPKPIDVKAVTEQWDLSTYTTDEKRRGRHDNSRLRGNRRSGPLDRVGRGGLDSARQAVIGARGR